MKGNGRTLSCPVKYISGEEVVGRATVFYKSNHNWKPGNSVFVCPACGDVWGKVVVEGTWATRFSPLSIRCKLHGGGNFTASAARMEHCDFDLEYDADLLRHDFLVMYDYWVVQGVERFVNEGGTCPTILGDNLLKV